MLKPVPCQNRTRGGLEPIKAVFSAVQQHYRKTMIVILAF
jgi:hypothetical protein